jgi:hypothetical protein
MLVSTKGIGDLEVPLLSTKYIADCTTGAMVDCDAFSNMLNPTCWGMCTYTAPLPTGVVQQPDAKVISFMGLSATTTLLLAGGLALILLVK